MLLTLSRHADFDRPEDRTPCECIDDERFVDFAGEAQGGLIVRPAISERP